MEIIAALCLLGVIDRQTRDCDVLYPDLNQDILEAVKEFAEQSRRDGIALDDKWLNNGPSSLSTLLPSGWLERVASIFQGRSIHIQSLCRSDLLLSKLFALCDRGTDIGDCLALRPTEKELDDSIPWIIEQDGNPMWPQHVQDTVSDLRKRLFDVVPS